MIAQTIGWPGARPRLRQTTGAAVAAALALLVGMAPGSVLSQGATIKIGVPAPLSGSSANAGTDIVNGAKLAAARINAAGGVLGKQIELVPEGDACDAQTAVQAAQKLVDAGVVAVAGGYCSSAALPESTTFHRAEIPYVLDASTNPQLTEMGYARGAAHFRGAVGGGSRLGIRAPWYVK
jgi:ABC-type branched-subunit amino acid transport system substrate-binding protein